MCVESMVVLCNQSSFLQSLSYYVHNVMVIRWVLVSLLKILGVGFSHAPEVLALEQALLV